MEELYVICPNKRISDQLKKMIYSFTKNFSSVVYVSNPLDYEDFKNRKILFSLELDDNGFDIPMFEFLSSLNIKDSNDIFENSTAAIIVHSNSELGTKRSAQDTIFIANNLGCTFIGQPLVEATANLKNFLTWQKVLKLPLREIPISLSCKLGKRLLNYKNKPCSFNSKKITVLYSSPHKVSNTLDLWHLISKYLKDKDIDIQEIQIENGKVVDCKGCHYKLCLHYGRQNSCFYGGFITESVLPSIQCSNIVVWLCPNYNDSIGANLTAVINRLTVLYHKISFYDKLMFGVVISGNSGSDSVAKQLIGALNVNKGFRLPPHAVITETANDPGAIYKIPDIEIKAQNFAKNMLKSL